VTRPILFLTDYGLDDDFVGLCHAVIARITPGARVLDLAHGVPRHDVLRGALVLADATPYAPADSVYLGVVDPGVGTERRPVVVESGEALLVGPDNGLLALAWDALGGAKRAFAVESPDVLLTRVSATFHGRDVFAPAAAHLAAGLDPAAVGPAVDPSSLVRVAVPMPEVEPGRVVCRVVAVDRFGNVQLAAGPDVLEEAGIAGAPRLEVRAKGHRIPAREARTFAEVAQWAVGILVNSSGRLALVRDRDSAAESLDLSPGDAVEIALPGVGGPGKVIPLPGPFRPG
jgi:S-adenosyl-L-methionine hydrolase (adenosine-forming)